MRKNILYSILVLGILFNLLIFSTISTVLISKNPMRCLDLGSILGVGFEDTCYMVHAQIYGGKHVCSVIENPILSEKCYGIDIKDPAFDIDIERVKQQLEGHYFENLTFQDVRWKQAEFVTTRCTSTEVNFLVIYENPIMFYCPTHIRIHNQSTEIGDYSYCSTHGGKWGYHNYNEDFIWQAWQDNLRNRKLLDEYLAECHIDNEMFIGNQSLYVISVSLRRPVDPKTCRVTGVQFYLTEEYVPIRGVRRDIEGDCTIY